MAGGVAAMITLLLYNNSSAPQCTGPAAVMGHNNKKNGMAAAATEPLMPILYTEELKLCVTYIYYIRSNLDLFACAVPPCLLDCTLCTSTTLNFSVQVLLFLSKREKSKHFLAYKQCDTPLNRFDLLDLRGRFRYYTNFDSATATAA